MKTKLRASKISIESPKPNSEVWIHLEIEQVIYDDTGKIINIIPRYDYMSEPIADFLNKSYTEGEQTITGLEVIGLVTKVILSWMSAKYHIIPDNEGNLWLS